MNTNNNIKTCCEKCYIYGSYADIRCYNLKCPCHSDTSEKECECLCHKGDRIAIGLHKSTAPCTCSTLQPIQSSWEERFEQEFGEKSSFYKMQALKYGTSICNLELNKRVKNFIKNLLETEHKS